MRKHLLIPAVVACLVGLFWGPVGGLFAFFAALFLSGAIEFLAPFLRE